MKHHIILANVLREYIEYDKETDKLLSEYDDLVDVFCDDKVAVVVIPTIHYEFYDTHPDGELGTGVRRITFSTPLPDDEPDYLQL